MDIRLVIPSITHSASMQVVDGGWAINAAVAEAITPGPGSIQVNSDQRTRVANRQPRTLRPKGVHGKHRSTGNGKKVARTGGASSAPKVQAALPVVPELGAM